MAIFLIDVNVDSRTSPWGSLALPVAPVVEEQDVYPQAAVEEHQLLQPVADVSPVAMEPYPGELAIPFDEPAV